VFYRDEEELAEQVSEYPDHRRSFGGHLAGLGVDVAAASVRDF
jgi:hypothetical protein